MSYRAIVMGASAGGLNAIMTIVSALPADFKLPIVVVQHLSPISDSYWISHIDRASAVTVKEADEKEKIEGGVVYVAPPNYHLMIERNETLSLSVDVKVNYARPSIDVLFESAADAYKDQLIGVVLTGSNSDGAAGLRRIKSYGGLAVAQQPDTAESSFMPAAAIEATEVDYILTLSEIAHLLTAMGDTAHSHNTL